MVQWPIAKTTTNMYEKVLLKQSITSEKMAYENQYFQCLLLEDSFCMTRATS